MSFQLTPKHRWYVNKVGHRCEAALLNGVWAAVWIIDGVPLVTTHTADGKTTAMFGSCWDITAPFEGWLSNPFAFRPDWVEYATSNALGEFELWGNRPSIDGIEWFDFEEGESTFMGESKYTGDWRNSLTCREDWQ